MKLINKILLSILVLVIAVPLSFGIDGIVKERHLRDERAMFQQNHMRTHGDGSFMLTRYQKHAKIPVKAGE